MQGWSSIFLRWFGTLLLGSIGLWLILGFTELTGAPDWGFPLALLFLIPVIFLPLQPLVTGTNRLAVAGLDRYKSRFSLRLLFAGVPNLLLWIGLALLVIALARPRVTNKDVVRKSDGLDILLAIDTSGSMKAQDLSSSGAGVNRLEVAKGVVAEFVESRPNDRMGVVVFGEEAFTHVPLTLDHETLTRVLKEVEIGVAGARGTAIGSAIAVSSKRMLALESPSRIVILLTDGQSNAGRLKPVEAAEAAAALNIRVYTIGVGAPAQRRSIFGQVFAADGLDETTLRAIADTTGGRYFRATSTRALQDVYDTIDQLEPSPAEIREVVSHQEWYRRALVPGVLCLLLSMLLSATWLRRWP